ncbi:Flp family type IVb pilin [Virgibacillus sp. JSM 102003]|uniref:Flp family type IVb pilin n=1 Tax=Virgibacillus sp. JSM 102003 TaxID=1562108 RepID=UPI0035C09F76
MNHFIRLFKEEEGQALTEYGLLIGLVALAVVAMLGFFGSTLVNVFEQVKDELKAAL